jgi:hypothetical protein
MFGSYSIYPTTCRKNKSIIQLDFKANSKSEYFQYWNNLIEQAEKKEGRETICKFVFDITSNVVPKECDIPPFLIYYKYADFRDGRRYYEQMDLLERSIRNAVKRAREKK